MSILGAAAVDGEGIPWRAAVAPGGRHGCGRCNWVAARPLQSKAAVVSSHSLCLDSDLVKRPLLNDVQTTLRSVPQ